MDITTLKAVLIDLRKIILPSRFEKAQQPEISTIQLGFRTIKSMVWIEISWQAEAPRLVQIPPPERLEGQSTLAQQVQHGLSKMALLDIKQKGFERVIEFSLANRLSEPCQKTIVIELMGRHSNFLLLDKNKKVITLGRQVREKQSRIRPISTGDKYVEPPSMQGFTPSIEEPYEAWRKRLSLLPLNLKDSLQNTYQGISPSLAIQLAGDSKESAEKLLKMSVKNLNEKEWEYLFKRWKTWLDKFNRGELCIYFECPTQYSVWKSDDNEKFNSTKDTSLKLGIYYRDLIEAKRLKHLTIRISNKLIKLKTFEEKSLEKHYSMLQITDKLDTIKSEADSLLSQQNIDSNSIKKAQKLYKRYQKLKRSIPIINERIDHHKIRIEKINESMSFMDNILCSELDSKSKRSEVIIELEKEIEDLILPNKQYKNRQVKKNNIKKAQLNFIEVLSPGGLIIQIGRNHRQNEFISLKKSRNGDLWFHAQECPGSHVILKASNGLANNDDMKVAADLAAYFSRAKGNTKVPILVVPTSNLKKIQGSLPGTVSFDKANITWGDPNFGKDYINNK